MRHGMLVELHKVIDIIERFYVDNEYTGSSDAFFSLVELCVEDRPDESVIGLIDYRVSASLVSPFPTSFQCIDPLAGSWLKHMASLIEKYIAQEGNSIKRREKALVVLNETYNKYRLLYEQDIIRQLILKFCSHIANEPDATFQASMSIRGSNIQQRRHFNTPKLSQEMPMKDLFYNVLFQYQLINVLFAVAKTVTLRVNSDNDLFKEIVKKIDELLNGSVKTFGTLFYVLNNPLVTNDNLEVVAASIGDVLNERWKSFDINLINMLFAMLIRHIQLQYFNEFKNEIGADVRARIFESLLLVHCDPLTGQMSELNYFLMVFKFLARVIVVSSPSQIKRVTNTRVVRVGDDTAGEFSWAQTCQIVTQALLVEKR